MNDAPDPRERSRCANCPNAKSPVVPTERHDGAKLLLIGEAPGRDELDQGQPFIGSSGRLLGRTLQPTGIKRSDCTIMNATSCMPGGTKDFQEECRKACQGRVDREIEDAVEEGAKIIVPLGAVALRSVLHHQGGILDYRGSIIPKTYVLPPGPGADARERRFKTHIMPVTHPAFVLRALPWEPLFRADLLRVKRVLDSGWTPPEDDPGREILIARNLDDIWRGLELFETATDPDLGEIAADVETTMDSGTRAQLHCYGLSNGPTTLVIPWVLDRKTLQPFWTPEEEKLIVSFTAKLFERHTIVTQNGPAFDFLVFDRYGMPIYRWHDTMVGQHAIRGHMPKNLGHVASTYLDVDPWKTYGDRSADMEELMTYNARDALRTILTWKLMKREMGL